MRVGGGRPESIVQMQMIRRNPSFELLTKSVQARKTLR